MIGIKWNRRRYIKPVVLTVVIPITSVDCAIPLRRAHADAFLFPLWTDSSPPRNGSPSPAIEH